MAAPPKPKHSDALQEIQMAIVKLSRLPEIKAALEASVDAEAVAIEASQRRDDLRREVEALRQEQQGLTAAVRKLYEEERTLRPGVEARRKEVEDEHKKLCDKLHEDVSGLQRQKAELAGEIQALIRRFNPE